MHLLKCSVCGEEYQRKDNWTEHLFGNNHQSKARMECHRWTNEIRNCVIIVYCRFPVSSPSGHKLLHYLSKDLATFVTDLVWKETNPRVALVQFESRSKSQAVAQGSKSCQIRIDDHLVQLKLASELMDVEWEVLLPEVPDLELPAPTAARVEKKVIEPAGQCFQKGISEMLEAVIIPDSEYNKAVIVMESIKNVTAGLLENGGSPHVHMFRNWYLQLKNSVNNVLLIHISLENEASPDYRRFLYYEQIFPKMSSEGFRRYGIRDPYQETSAQVGISFIHVETGVEFRLCTTPLVLVEVQRSRLLQYYCRFDPRIKPFLGVIHLWAIVNEIRIGLSNGNPLYSHCNVPDPAALEWLVVFFLCDKGLIPTPRELQSQPHKRLALQSGQLLSFTEDPKFAADWSSHKEDPGKVVVDLLTLAEEFFAFTIKILERVIGGGPSRCVVLNTRDAEVLHKEDICQPPKNTPSPSFTTKLTPNEMSNLRAELSKPVYNTRRLVMMHPFNIKWQFSFNDKSTHLKTVITQIMRSTQKKLQKFLKKCERDTGTPCTLNSADLKALLVWTGKRKSSSHTNHIKRFTRRRPLPTKKNIKN